MMKKNTIPTALLLAATLLLASCPAILPTAAAQSNVQAVAHIILARLSHTDDQILAYVWGPVSKGDSIMGTKEHVYDIPGPGYVLYLDLSPQRNLFHPVQYVYYSASTTKITVFDANSPPENFKDYHAIDTPFMQGFLSARNIRPQTHPGAAPATSGRDNRWVILMNGGYDSSNNHIRYWDDLSNIYITLTEVYGYADENIITLCSDGLDPTPDQSNGQNSNPDLDADGDADIMYACLLSTVNAVFTNLAANFSGGEKLFIFTTDHGGTDGGLNTYENLWNHEELSDAHFAELLALFPDNVEILCTFEPCYSGGFIDNVVVPPGPVVASSACRYDESSYAMLPYPYYYDEYVFHWTAAMKWEDAYGVAVNADNNSDGVISFREAFDYAVEHDTQTETPMYDDYPDNIGERITLWVSDPPPENVSVPQGPDEGITGRLATFTTSATDPAGQTIFFRFDWGDGNLSAWLGPYQSGSSCNSSHAWMIEGAYNIRAKAKDEVGSESAWTAPHVIAIHELPVLAISSILPGKARLMVGIKNIGTMNVSDLNWSITLKGLVLLGRKTTAENQRLNVNYCNTLETKFILGFGPATINVRLETMGEVFQRNATASIMLCFIKNVQLE